jgi:hypothetical protein
MISWKPCDGGRKTKAPFKEARPVGVELGNVVSVCVDFTNCLGCPPFAKVPETIVVDANSLVGHASWANE